AAPPAGPRARAGRGSAPTASRRARPRRGGSCDASRSRGSPRDRPGRAASLMSMIQQVVWNLPDFLTGGDALASPLPAPRGARAANNGDSAMRVWFITGASRGSGALIAAEALRAGDAVVAAARNPKGVTEALGAHERLLPVALDVTQDEQARAAVA